MSHIAQVEFVQLTKSLFPEMFVKRKVLEIGSLDVNGTIRGFFKDCDYTGLDIGEGSGVDVVCEGQKYDAPSASYDVVISCEVMEHNPYWAETLENMIRLLKPGGLMIMSCATAGRPEHGTARSEAGSSPLTVEQGWNYYRNLAEKDIVAKVNLSSLPSKAFAVNWNSWDLYFLGVKAGGNAAVQKQIAKFKAYYRGRIISAWYDRFCRVARNPSRAFAFLNRHRPISPSGTE